MASEKVEQFNHFNADAMAAALEPPSLTVGRYLYRGRLLSLLDWLPFWERVQQIDAMPVSEAGPGAVERLRERERFFRSFLRAQFPKRDFRFWAPDPVNALMKQPFHVIEETCGFFFTLQALASFGRNAIERAAREPSTPSKPNSNATPPAGAASE